MIPAIHSEWWANLALDVGVIVLALLLDRFLPERPARVHPVVWMGRMISGLEQLTPCRPAAALAYGAVGVTFTIGTWGTLTWLATVGLSKLGTIAYLIGGAILLMSGVLFGFPIRQSRRVMPRDQPPTESPNAGWTMSAMAGLPGRRLEKPDHYDLGAEFPQPDAADIGRCNRLAAATALLGVIVALGVLTLRHWIAS